MTQIISRIVEPVGTLSYRTYSRCAEQMCMRKLIRAHLEDKAQTLKPDLIILDASMPRMNGIEAAPKLKELLPETPIILFTFHEGLMRGFDACEVGVDAGVTKASGMFH